MKELNRMENITAQPPAMRLERFFPVIHTPEVCPGSGGKDVLFTVGHKSKSEIQSGLQPYSPDTTLSHIFR